MAYPQPKVYVAFDDGPYVLSPTWTEITTSVRSMSIDRGRSDDWGTFSGSAAVVLNNRARLFDPFYTSGTYYGKLLPRRQIKIEATYASTTYSVFRGFIDGWPPTWTDAGGDSTVTISCYDAMALLAQVQLPADWSRSYILSTSPRHYYPCDDPIIPFQSGVMTDYGSTQKNLTVQTNATSGNQLATGLVNRSLAGTPNATTDYIATNDPGLLSRVPVFTADNDFAVSFWIIPETPSTSSLISGQVCNFNWYVSFASGRFTFGVASGAAVSPNFWTWTTTSQVLNPAEPVHVAVSFNAAAKSAAILINGIDVTGTRTTTSTIVLATTADFTTVSMGPIQQIIVWQNAITTTVVQNIIRYSQANFYETTAARVSRIIAETPFSTSLVSANGTQYIAEITDDAPYASPELHRRRSALCQQNWRAYTNGNVHTIYANKIFQHASHLWQRWSWLRSKCCFAIRRRFNAKYHQCQHDWWRRHQSDWISQYDRLRPSDSIMGCLYAKHQSSQHHWQCFGWPGPIRVCKVWRLSSCHFTRCKLGKHPGLRTA
jgi:hypothetical protein